MVSSTRAIVVGVLVACGSVLGCSLASPTYITSTQESAVDEEDAASSSSSSSSATPSGGPAVTCNASDFAKVDLAKLKACGPGNKGGHCYARAKSPIADELVACAGSPNDVCVPDEIILAAGKPLKSCTSIIGPGACVSTGFLPKMDTQGAGSLKQDVCATHQILRAVRRPHARQRPHAVLPAHRRPRCGLFRRCVGR